MTSRSSKSNGNNRAYQNNRTGNNLMIGDFKIGAKLGQGTFSKVCQGIHMPTGEKVAIKIMSKDQIKEKSGKIRIEKEINIQKKLHHQNIVQQYAIIETESKIYIISEYCSGGELFDYIVSKRKLYETEACRIYQQLISGLEYLHKQRICHRDLKPENLLFDSKHILKIADFGLSNDYHKGKLSTPCGSPCYAAPEMVTGKKYSGSSVDIWSSGIVLYTMVCGFLPFEDDNQNILFGKIAKGLFSLPSFLSAPCKDLLKKILVTDPQKRYGFEEIKHHAWFLSVNNVMGKNIFFNSPGVFIEEDVIPIDIEIVAEIYNDFHFDIDKIINDVLRNRHNKITTIYYLILKRKIRNKENSVSDISSNSNNFIKYIKSSISKMGYWNNDYEKITEYYTNLVKKFLNAISEENSISFEPRNKNNGNISNKENNNNINNIIKTSITNIDNLNLNKIISNNTPNDYRCHTDLSDNSNKKNINNENQNNNQIINHPVQNGGIDIRINTLYDNKINMIPKLPLNSLKDPKKQNNNNINKIYILDTDETPTPKIKESYRPKIPIKQFLQTDANNIKMNNKLIKENNNLQKENKLNINNNKNILTDESNNNVKEKEKNEEQKETTTPNVNRILLTEMDNIDINNIQKSLLNKKSDLNNNIINNSKNVNLKNYNNDYIRVKTLYNKDDSDENIKLSINENIKNSIKKENSINNKIEGDKKTPSNKDKVELKNNNNYLAKAINGLNEDNYINNKSNNITKSIEKTTEDSNRNSNYNNNKTSSTNENKEKINKFSLNMVSLPSSNQIYKKLTTYSEKQQKFINHKKSSMPKKEDSRRENIGLENGRLLYMNKNKYKNRYSQEHKNINNGNTMRANGSNEISYINRNIYNNPNDILYMRKKKRPKSIDDNTNYNNKLLNDLNSKENNIININSFNRKKSKENINNNNDFHYNMNNNRKIIYKNIINDKKFIDESYIESFRFKNLNKKTIVTKLNKKNDSNDFNNISRFVNRNNNNNFFIEKMKKRDNYMLLNNDLNNYTNISMNKNNKLHEHNSFDIPKNIKNKINRNYINNSIEKTNIQSNNNRNILKPNNNNYYKLNKRIKQFYRNINNKQNTSETQNYVINNYNNNYNMDKLSNEKVMINKKINNYRIANNFKLNSVDFPKNNTNRQIYDMKNILKNKRQFYLNTSVIKDKTPRKLNTNFILDNNIRNNNINKNKNNYYLNTMENNNNNNTIHKYTDEGRYLTFKDNDNSKRINHFHKYLVPIHKRYNFSQEPDKKRKGNEGFEVISPYGKGNSFILSQNNNFLFNKDRNLNNLPNKNIKYINQYNNNKNILYENQKLIDKINNNDNKIMSENKRNENNMNIYCKKSFDKIKECVEKIIENKVNIAKNNNSFNKNLICTYNKERTNIINFILNISKNSGKKDYLIISPKLMKGNANTFKLIIEKIKNQLT